MAFFHNPPINPLKQSIYRFPPSFLAMQSADSDFNAITVAPLQLLIFSGITASPALVNVSRNYTGGIEV